MHVQPQAFFQKWIFKMYRLLPFLCFLFSLNRYPSNILEIPPPTHSPLSQCTPLTSMNDSLNAERLSEDCTLYLEPTIPRELCTFDWVPTRSPSCSRGRQRHSRNRSTAYEISSWCNSKWSNIKCSSHSRTASTVSKEYFIDFKTHRLTAEWPPWSNERNQRVITSNTIRVLVHRHIFISKKKIPSAQTFITTWCGRAYGT